jgi:hypothetical protein
MERMLHHFNSPTKPRASSCLTTCVQNRDDFEAMPGSMSLVPSRGSLTLLTDKFRGAASPVTPWRQEGWQGRYEAEASRGDVLHLIMNGNAASRA